MSRGFQKKIDIFLLNKMHNGFIKMRTAEKMEFAQNGLKPKFLLWVERIYFSVE